MKGKKRREIKKGKKGNFRLMVKNPAQIFKIEKGGPILQKFKTSEFFMRANWPLFYNEQ